MTDWSAWKPHDGKSRPVALGVMVEVETCARWPHDGQLIEGVTYFDGPLPCEDWQAWYDGPCTDESGLVIRYRVVKPKGLELLERVAAKQPIPAWAVKVLERME